MIDERIISEKFSVVWKENFPLLSTTFIKKVNHYQIIEINKNQIQTYEDVRNDLVAELAFNLAEKVINTGINPEIIIKDVTIIKETISNSIIEIGKEGIYSTQLTEVEKDVTLKICNNTIEFIKAQKPKEIIFKPRIKGYGLMSEMIGDLSIDDTLYEIKTVADNFLVSHLRQLLIYLALKQVSGEKQWTNGGLYNPKNGVYYKFNVRQLITQISGGNSQNEVFKNFLNSLMRDINLDTRF